MQQTKPFWSSWTLWGALATFLGIILPGLGFDASPAVITGVLHSWQQVLDSVLTFGGLIGTVYGRVTATKILTRK
jgi:hypothetical protein